MTSMTFMTSMTLRKRQSSGLSEDGEESEVASLLSSSSDGNINSQLNYNSFRSKMHHFHHLVCHTPGGKNNFLSWCLTIIATIFHLISTFTRTPSCPNNRGEYFNLVVLSLILYTLSFGIVIFYELKKSKNDSRSDYRSQKKKKILVMFCVLIITLYYDRWMPSRNRSRYNASQFLLIGASTLAFLSCVSFSKTKFGTKKTKIGLGSLFGVAALVFISRVAYGQRNWSKGLFDKFHMDNDLEQQISKNNGKVIEPTVCRIRRPRWYDIPWPDVFSYSTIFKLMRETENCDSSIPHFSNIQYNQDETIVEIQCPTPDEQNQNTHLKHLHYNNYHWDISEEYPRTCPLGLPSGYIENLNKWPLQHCRPTTSKNVHNLPWIVMNPSDVFSSFPTWDNIPIDVRLAMGNSPKKYAKSGNNQIHQPFEKKNKKGNFEISLPEEFQQSGGLLKVKCPYEPQENYHFVAPNPSTTEYEKSTCSAKKKKLDIHMMMIDSLSRAHTHRIMPQTMKALKSITKPAPLNQSPWMNMKDEDEDVYAFEFFRFHATDVNTGPNFGALAFNERSARDAMVSRLSLPYIPTEKMIWNVMQKAMPQRKTAILNELCQDVGYGYTTNSSVGVDHHFYTAFCHVDAFPQPEPWGNIDGSFGAFKRCFNGKQQHIHSLEYAENYILNHNKANIPYFLMTIFMEAHEMTGELLKRSLDSRMARYFDTFTKAPYKPCPDSEKTNPLQHTLHFLFADHGLLMGANAMTNLGKTENHTPVLFVTVPGWFLRKYPKIAEALTINQYRLIGMFDLYASLASLTKLEEFTSSYEKGEKEMEGIFKEQDASRTCDDIDVAFKEGCMCERHE